MLTVAANMDGRTTNESASLRFKLHNWRREFKVSYQDMLDTPLEVILTDLEYIRIVDKVMQDKSKNGHSK